MSSKRIVLSMGRFALLPRFLRKSPLWSLVAPFAAVVLMLTVSEAMAQGQDCDPVANEDCFCFNDPRGQFCALVQEGELDGDKTLGSLNNEEIQLFCLEFVVVLQGGGREAGCTLQSVMGSEDEAQCLESNESCLEREFSEPLGGYSDCRRNAALFRDTSCDLTVARFRECIVPLGAGGALNLSCALAGDREAIVEAIQPIPQPRDIEACRQLEAQCPLPDLEFGCDTEEGAPACDCFLFVDETPTDDCVNGTTAEGDACTCTQEFNNDPNPDPTPDMMEPDPTPEMMEPEPMPETMEPEPSPEVNNPDPNDGPDDNGGSCSTTHGQGNTGDLLLLGMGILGVIVVRRREI